MTFVEKIINIQFFPLDNYTFRNLIENGLPEIFQDMSDSSAHVHKDLTDVTCIEKEFGLIGPSVNDLVTKSSKPSALLVVKEQAAMKYNSENEVEQFVHLYVRDLLHAMGISDVEVRKGIEIIRLRPDLWLLTLNNIPILAIEVKKPQTGILDHPKVVSQLAQYMKIYRSFRGLCQVFGVLTTFREWKLIWLPDCDDYAASTSLEGVAFEMDENAILNNVVSGTPVLNGHDPSIHHYLASVILKSYHGSKLYQFRLSNIPNRLVVCANNRMLIWKRCQWKENDRFCFTLPSKATTNFYLLEDLSFGAHGRLWIATSPTTTSRYSVFVIKVFAKKESNKKRSYETVEEKEEHVEDILRYEKACWTTLKFRVVEVSICGNEALLLPVAITASSAEVWNTSFFMQIKGYMDPVLCEMIESYLQVHTPREVATLAIETLSNVKILHRDIKWVHVAVVPVYQERPTPSYTMRPTFIDFGTCTLDVSPALAKQEMAAKIGALI